MSVALRTPSLYSSCKIFVPPSSSSPQATAHCRHAARLLFPNAKAVTHSFTKTIHLHTERLCQVRRLCCGKEEEELDVNYVSQKTSDIEPSLGVAVALAMLRFYRNEISPFLPGSCRFVPSCSEYSMQAYKKYGVVKGTILTAWRLLRCNPLGPSGFDPPRWFGESRPPEV